MSADPDAGTGPDAGWYRAELDGCRSEIAALRSILGELISRRCDLRSPCVLMVTDAAPGTWCLTHDQPMPCAFARACERLGELAASPPPVT